ncbi:hypothetical protein sos41_21560 [Alphaproteobacteria bacterium SO-S41]|nr:hypothetical protein sos41_21560 [Alphaproteobacteria bacterium SO-S41]
METFWHDLSWVPPLRTPFRTDLANLFTELGYAQFFIAFLPIAYWLWDKHVGTRLALLIIFTAVLNGFCKDLFQDPRPDAAFSLDGRVDPTTSYGMPSGHAQVAVAMWLWLAWEIRRWWAWPIAVIVALGVIASRLYLGVHDVEDVMVGATLGLLTLPVFAFFLSGTFKGWRAQPWFVHLLAIFALQATLWVFWPGPNGPGTKFAVGGLLTGWWMGVLIEQRAIGFRRHENWLIAIAAAAVAIAVIFLALTRIEPGLMALGLEKVWARWLQYAAIALFITAAAPWLFLKAGAAQLSK